MTINLETLTVDQLSTFTVEEGIKELQNDASEIEHKMFGATLVYRKASQASDWESGRAFERRVFPNLPEGKSNGMATRWAVLDRVIALGISPKDDKTASDWTFCTYSSSTARVRKVLDDSTLGKVAQRKAIHALAIEPKVKAPAKPKKTAAEKEADKLAEAKNVPAMVIADKAVTVREALENLSQVFADSNGKLDYDDKELNAIKVALKGMLVTADSIRANGAVPKAPAKNVA